ncbi:GNAT family N-acetyltransferase [Novosphingobium mangrovi (ex Huang et al. 2023)]|uniref:GNAT family N-acetyltransferase n=1 Tax=Novosphingobium mangrovi (ex Huang et al. 2023) TaxID=2976432 RepID=A0ABT2I2K5_9SPHN|nr:GNAT family N-acetyltransferase [Novosphingobium mangrovi (ex Huang et al. 2023)]MCT2399037.1 GNAT family N-acetyltransferase [Novosphingobium mangrovi (ex Huang et al. 2023)]
MELRLANPADAADLARLGAHSFTVKFGHLYRPEDLHGFLAEAHTEAKAAKEIADPKMRVILAEQDGRLLGYCKLVMACGWPEHARGERAIELKQLYTDPETTGQGIGARLMDWALEEARRFGADEIQLSVYSDNPGAQKFYRRYGFEKAADIHFMVGEQRDEEFLFAKVL